MKNSLKNKKSRPPVVVIVGHVDHGKTSILDAIRKSKVAEQESGGITQHIGAYQVEHKNKSITFIDTPGHEAFSAMRSRGVRVADIAILVIAADDGIMPQTKEAIKIIQKSGLPYIVAFNKIDKANADIQKAKNQLTEQSVLLEGYGGDVPFVEVSAKTGQGLDELLDLINLIAEVEEFNSEENESIEMVVIEAALDAKVGSTATFIVKKGNVTTRNIIAGSSTYAKIKNMHDFLGNSVIKASPSMPVVITGFSSVPRVGEKFVEVSSIREAEDRVKSKQRKEKKAEVLEIQEGQKVINIILKADVEGTLEAVHLVLRSINNEKLILRIIDGGVGSINDSDIKLAEGGRAFVVGFRVKLNKVTQNLVEQKKVTVILFDTIYELVEGVREVILEQLEPVESEEMIGKMKVLKIFKSDSSSMIIGGKIISGMLRRGVKLNVIRNREEIGTGLLKRLKSIDKDIDSIEKGNEAGVLFEGNIKIEEGDILEAIETKTTKPSL